MDGSDRVLHADGSDSATDSTVALSTRSRLLDNAQPENEDGEVAVGKSDEAIADPAAVSPEEPADDPESGGFGVTFGAMPKKDEGRSLSTRFGSRLSKRATNHGSVRSAREFPDPTPDGEVSRQNSHACSVELVEKLLETNMTQGLTSTEAQERLAIYGLNKLAEAKPDTFLKRLWRQINEILTWILLATALISGILQSWAELALILAVVVINVTIGLIQEGKASKATQALKNMLSSKATVIRDGMRMDIDATQVVPGDIVFLESGNKVPADIRMFHTSNLAVQEAMLTGESLPANKNTTPVPPNTGIGDRKNMCYSATLVVKGQGSGICVATGDTTEIGRIAELVSEVRSVKSNLLRQIDAFGRWIGIIVIPTAIVTFLIAYLTPINLEGETTTNSSDKVQPAIIIAVAVAVSIIPAGLQAIITICMAVAVKQMAENNAIVKTLPSVEVLGNVMVICSDKTGTLTKNEMTGVAARTQSFAYKVTGVGYDSAGGKIVPEGKETADGHEDQALDALVRGALLNNEARLDKTVSNSNKPMVIAVGDPTECALLCLSEKFEKAKEAEIRASFPRVGVIPFESEHKFMVTFHSLSDTRAEQDKCLAIVKGAPDRLLVRCQDALLADGTTTPVDREHWSSQIAELSSKGYRCLALCQTYITSLALPDAVAQGPKWLMRDPFLTLVGIVAILDPPRDECIEAIKLAHKAGITVKMITGDHPATALAIGRMLGIVDDSHLNVLTGPELDAMSLPALEKVVVDVNTFARASPDNKINIVRALQNRGKVCSMTGDGVNDAPALRAADVGVAMGITGSDVSKDAAKIILADDNFANILVAVKQGRRVWDNLRKIVIFNMPANFAQAGIIFFAVCLQWSVIPLTAIQVLYVNMITCCTLGLILALEPPEPTVMNRPPRRLGKGFIGRFFYWRVFYVSAIFIFFVLGSVAWIRNHDEKTYGPAHQRSIAFNCLIFCQVGYAFNCRFLHLASFHPRILSGNPGAWMCAVIIILFNFGITYIPGLNDFFSMTGMDGMQWGIVFLFCISAFLLIEVEKQLATPLRPYTSRLVTSVEKGISLICCCIPNGLRRFWAPPEQRAPVMEPTTPKQRQGGSLRPVSIRRLVLKPK